MAAPVKNLMAPSPRASGEASNCTTWGYVDDFNVCQDLLALYDLTIAELYSMNPSIGPDCTGLAIGTYYCVSWFPDGLNPPDWGYQYTDTAIPTTTSTATGTISGVSTPSPVQTDITSSCDKFYFVQQGDSCYSIAQNNSITLDEFYAWNPAVEECADLEYGYYVCVGVSAAATSATATSTPTTGTTGTATQTIITTPTPYQTGMASNCDKFYDVGSGDGCWGISSSYGIALSDFYGWNPGVSSCSALYPGYYVCVGTEAAGASKRTAFASVTAGPAMITAA
ncbi:hypothetical protein Daus18300_005529 [Diaporthe australafricana]|uniref:LysM domain-containing protein n=1 Tax=Diaporthe australafricana TaxID=127596 RepID=A0ABR3X213_9PEZI